MVLEKYRVGDLCHIAGSSRKGTIAYVGSVEGLPEGDWYGIRLNEPEGKNDGTRDGKTYFECLPNHGVFVRKNKIVVLSSDLRKVERQIKAQEQMDQSDPTESIDAYAKMVAERKQKIEELLKQAQDCQNDKAEVNKILDRALHEVALFREESAKSSVFLSNHDIRQSQITVASYTEKIEQAKSALIPRKKFAFGNRRRAAGPKDPKSTKLTLESNATSDALKSTNEVAFDNRKDETIRISASDTSNSSDVVLSNLTDCLVYVEEIVYAIRMNKLIRCIIVTAPVPGSILMHDCQDCKFILATQQLRVHGTYDSDFYLRMRSTPIIEDCARLRFAPHPARDDATTTLFKKTDMIDENGLWEKVNDFKWLRSQHSPNWSTIPEEDRQTLAQVVHPPN